MKRLRGFIHSARHRQGAAALEPGLPVSRVFLDRLVELADRGFVVLLVDQARPRSRSTRRLSCDCGMVRGVGGGAAAVATGASTHSAKNNVTKMRHSTGAVDREREEKLRPLEERNRTLAHDSTRFRCGGAANGHSHRTGNRAPGFGLHPAGDTGIAAMALTGTTMPRSPSDP